VEIGQKLDLLERDSEQGALENLVGSGDAEGVLMAIGAGRSRNRRALVRRLFGNARLARATPPMPIR
jgi:hypothetical protein